MRFEDRESGLVVGVDGSTASDAAVSWTAREAALHSLPIELLHAVAPTLADSTHGGVNQRQIDRAEDIIRRAHQVVKAVAGNAMPVTHSRVQYARVVPTLLQASESAHLIVIGRRAPDDTHRHRVGSVNFGLVPHAHCPVAVVNEAETGEQRMTAGAPVLVGIDGSPASEAAIAWAFEEASRRCAPLLALHAWSDVGVFPMLGMDWRTNRDQGWEVLGERLAGWHEQYPDVQVRRHLVADVPARWLVKESKGAQLVVVGSRGRGGTGLRLGSVSSTVARCAQAPAVVVGGKQR